MARLNNAYFSPYEMLITFLLNGSEKGIVAKLDAKLYPSEHQLFIIDHKRRHMSSKAINVENRNISNPEVFKKILKGSVFTLAHTFKSFRKSTSRFKSKKHIMRAILKPITGIGLIIRGLANIVFSLGSLLIFSFTYLPAWLYHLSKPKNERRITHTSIAFLYIRAFAHLIDGFSSIFSGMIQLLATPFTYFIQLPLRLKNTYDKPSKQMQYQRVEENAGVKKYMDIVQTLNDQSISQPNPADKAIIAAGCQTKEPVLVNETIADTRRYKYSRLLHYKILHAMDNGQPTDTLTDIANHNPAHMDDYAMYLDNKISR